jgi:hypothetical protein
MKKKLFLLITLCAAQTGFAQILVDYVSGNVGIGTTPQTHKLEVAGNMLVNGNIFIKGASNSLATTDDTPLVFKVNDSVIAGSTGYSGNTNVSFGYGSLRNSIGKGNTANGYYALFSNATGHNNTANGSYALFSNTIGHNNTANGYYALYSNETGYYNTASGMNSLSSNKSGNSNTANGFHALKSNVSGSENTANGFSALSFNTTGSRNAANGFNALNSNTTGSGNVANGYLALCSNTTGNSNTAIGSSANVSAGNLSNATAIGSGATATASNQVRIGNNSVISIGGYAAWTNISDGRAKKNIRADVPGLNFINSLQPVTYNLDLDAIDELLKSDDPEINRHKDSLRSSRSSEEKEFEAKSREVKQKRLQTGFVAQDVEKIAKSIGYDFSGVDVDEKGIYGLRYAEFVVPLVKAVQELSEKNETKDAVIASLQEQVDEHREQIKQLVKLMEIKSIDKKAFEENGIESIPMLLQNTPNPFSQATEIGYFIPETVNSANIYIYDVNGVQQKNISIAERGNGVTVLQATALQAGIYFYTLICDGKPVDTKQMILTR